MNKRNSGRQTLTIYLVTFVHFLAKELSKKKISLNAIFWNESLVIFLCCICMAQTLGKLHFCIAFRQIPFVKLCRTNKNFASFSVSLPGLTEITNYYLFHLCESNFIVDKGVIIRNDIILVPFNFLYHNLIYIFS